MRLLKGVLAAMGASVLLSLVQLIGDGQYQPRAEENYHPDSSYPGLHSSGDGWISVAMLQVQYGAIYYRSTFGEWPVNWAQVEASGIFQGNLVGLQMEIVDPDDGQLDFAGDAIYVRLPDDKAKVFYLGYPGTSTSDMLQIEIDAPSATYAARFSAYDQIQPDYELSSYTSDIRRLKLFAILGQCKAIADTYKMLHGNYPPDWNTLVASGLAPISPDSINPMTGAPFKGDGSPGDVIYQITDGQLHLNHIGLDGELPAARFSY